MGLPQEARQVAVPERSLRLVPGGLPLRRRNLRAPGVGESLREDGTGHRRRLHLLAPGPRDAPRVALVPEPRRALRQLQPARQAVQRGVDEAAEALAPKTGERHAAQTTSAATCVRAS